MLEEEDAYSEKNRKLLKYNYCQNFEGRDFAWGVKWLEWSLHEFISLKAVFPKKKMFFFNIRL